MKQRKMINIERIFIMLFAFITFFVVQGSKVQAACNSKLGTVKITATLSDPEAGTINIPAETCKSGYTWVGILPEYNPYNIEISVSLNEGYFFEGWIDSSGKTVSIAQKYTTTYEKDVSYTAKVRKMNVVARGSELTQLYESLDDALASGISPLYLLKSVTIDKDTVINGTLIITYANGVLKETEEGTQETAIQRASWTEEERFLHLTVEIKKGATLTINGQLTLGGVQHYPHQEGQAPGSQGITCGNYSKIVNNGNIIVNGTMKIYGLVTGTGLIEFNNGSAAYQPLTLNDFAGGQNTSDLYSANQLPFKQYALINVQCSQKYNYGSKLIGMSSIYASILGFPTFAKQEITFLGPSTSSGNKILIMNSNDSCVEMSYLNKSIKQAVGDIYLNDFGVTTFTLSGEITLGEFAIEFMGKKYSSSIGYFGLPYTFNFVIGKNGILNITSGYKYKLLPGSSVVVEEGGVVNVKSDASLVIYDSLIQSAMSGKAYPSADILSAHEFRKTADFIVNGTLNLENGSTFAGIIQTSTGTGIVNVGNINGDNMTVTITDGATTKYDKTTTVFDITPRIYGLNGYIEIEDNAVYKGFSSEVFTLDSFAVKQADGCPTTAAEKDYIGEAMIFCEGTTQTLNQEMQGRMLKWDGSKYVATVNHYIGEEIGDSANVIIVINGVSYKVNANGTFNASYTFSAGEDITYYTYDQKLEKSGKSKVNYSFVIDTYDDYILLDNVEKSVKLNSDNVYTIISDSNQNFDLKFTVTFYGGSSEVIDSQYPNLEESKIVHNVELTHPNYTIEDSEQTLTIIPKAYKEYKDAVDSLKVAQNIQEEASRLWQIYTTHNNSCKSSGNADDITFCDSYLDYSYGSTIATDIEIDQVTYGDTEVSAKVTKIDGTTSNETVKTSGYVGTTNISATFVYTVTYEGRDCSISKIITNIKSADITIKLKDIEVIYGEEEAELAVEITAGELVNNNKIKDVITISREEGDDVGVYDIDASKKHAGYNIVFENNPAKYTIKASTIEITVAKKNAIMLSNIDEPIKFESTVTGDGDTNPEIIYEIRKGNTVVARVDETGKILEINEKEYVDGDYKVYATVASPNYIVKETLIAVDFKVAKDEEYYEVIISFNTTEETPTYNGEEITKTVLVRVRDTKEVLKADHYTVLVNGFSTTQIIDAGEYTVTVKVGTITCSDTNSITIQAKELTLKVDNLDFTYNGSVQQPKFIIEDYVEGDDVKVNTSNANSTDKGNYEVSASLSGSDKDNYKLPEIKTQAYSIKALPIEVNVANHKDVMVSKKDFISDISVELKGNNGLTPIIKYEIRKENKLIATVNELGEVTIEKGETYGAGEYKVYAIVESPNYIVKDTSTAGSLNIVEDNNYYDVIVEFYKEGTLLEETTTIYDGKEISVVVTAKVADNPDLKIDNIAYTINGDEITKFKNTGTYTISVEVDTVSYNNYIAFVIAAKELTLKVDNLDFTYNGGVQQPKFIIEDYVEGDDVKVNTSNANSTDKGNYEVSASLSGSDKDNYKLPEIKTQAYSIKALPIEVNVANHKDVMVSKKDFISDISVELKGNNGLTPIIKYEIRKENKLIATVNELGEVTIEKGETYGAGEYKVYAIVESPNYELKSVSFGKLNIVPDEEYYEAIISFNTTEETPTYNGKEITKTVLVRVRDTKEVLETNTYTVLVNGSTNAKIIDAGEYTVTVKVGTITCSDTNSITIQAKELTLKVDNLDFTYNGSAQQPKFIIEDYVEGDDVKVNTSKNNSIYIGEYSVTASLSGKASKNYVLPLINTIKYKINPLDITVEIRKVSSIYGSSDAILKFDCDDTLGSADNIYNFISLRREAGLSVGLYDIYGTNSNENYNVTFEGEKDAYEIKQKNITVVVDNISVVYGEEEQELKAKSIESLAYADTLEGLISLSREANKNVGVYEIICENLNSNYNISFTKSTYSITPRKIEVKVNDVTSVYGDEFNDLTVTIEKGAMAYNENIYDLLSLSSNHESISGIYKITASKVENKNYDLMVSYTGAVNSIYEVVKRPITIQVSDIEVDSDAKYADIVSKIRYAITSGNIVNNDELNIDLSINLQSGITLNEENFESNFAGGVHSIIVKASNQNYNITLVNGKLIVTKRIVNVKDIITDYVYNVGEEIVPFDWTVNIDNYNASANNRSFSYYIEKENVNGEYIKVDSIVNAGKYRLTVYIVHTHAYEFKYDAKTVYDIVVDKKDISDEIVLYNIPKNNMAEYTVFGFNPGVEVSDSYAYVNYVEKLMYEGKEVSKAQKVGEYTYSVTIENENYKGYKQAKFNIDKKDISSNIKFDISLDEVIVLKDEINIGVTVENYDVKIIKDYVKLSGTEALNNSIREEGLYRLDVSIDDSCYKGKKSIRFNVVPSVDSKIDILDQIQKKLNQAQEIEEKEMLIGKMQTIIFSLTDYDKNQIEDNDEYRNILAACENEYQNFIQEKNEILKESSKSPSNLLWLWLLLSSLLAVSLITVVVMLHSKKNKLRRII